MGGIDGFLGTRASLMLDVVFLAMFVVVPAMALSVGLVRYRRLYALHKRIQLLLAGVLVAAVAAFEIDMRFISGWEDRAAESPYFRDWVHYSLYIHLAFSISTAVLWVWVVVQALRHIPSPPSPSAYSRRHIFWARLAALDMTATAVTGWIFYYLAFIARGE